MLSPFLVLKGAFLALKNNFLIIITAFSVLFCVFSFLLLIDSLASAFFISSVIDTVPNINLLRFKEVAFLPSSLMSTLAFFALFLPLVLGAERMALMWVKGEKTDLFELFWAFDFGRFWRSFVMHFCLFFTLFIWSVAMIFFAQLFSLGLGAFMAALLKYIFYGIGVCGGIVIFTFYLTAWLLFACGKSFKSSLISAFGKGEVKGLFSSLLPLVAVFLPFMFFGGLFLVSVPFFILFSAFIFDQIYFKKLRKKTLHV